MEAMDLNYQGKERSVRSLTEHTTFYSHIKITQYGNSLEDVHQKYSGAVCLDRLVDEPIIESYGKRWRISWKERPSFEPAGNSWWMKNKKK